MEPDEQTEPTYITFLWRIALRFPKITGWGAKKLGYTIGYIEGLTEFYRTGTERQREITRYVIAVSLLVLIWFVCIIYLLAKQFYHQI